MPSVRWVCGVTRARGAPADRSAPIGTGRRRVSKRLPAPWRRISAPAGGQVTPQEAEEGESGFVVAGGDAAELLETVEHPLDAVAVLVAMKIADDRLDAVRAGWDDRQDAAQQEGLSEVVAVVAFVGQEETGLGHWQGQQRQGALVVGSLAAGQEEAERASLIVCAGVDLARKAAA